MCRQSAFAVLVTMTTLLHLPITTSLESEPHNITITDGNGNIQRVIVDPPHSRNINGGHPIRGLRMTAEESRTLCTQIQEERHLHEIDVPENHHLPENSIPLVESNDDNPRGQGNSGQPINPVEFQQVLQAFATAEMELQEVDHMDQVVPEAMLHSQEL